MQCFFLRHEHDPTADAGKHIIVAHNIAMLLVHASYRRQAQKRAAGSDAALTQGRNFAA